jgi:very-short-patch-repair endonuclease
VGFYIHDFYIPSINLLCEVDGDYFHSNPEKYKKEDLNEMQRKNRRRDEKKTRGALGIGYKIERFWETDIINNPILIKERLRNLI